MTSHYIPRIFFLCFSLFSMLPAATVTVTDSVLRSANELEPLGVNYLGDAGGTKYSNGNLILQSSFDPVTMRNLYRVIDAGEENGRQWITLDGSGTSNWRLYTSGTYSGAEMRAYRFLDAAGHPLPYKDVGWAQGGKLLDATNGAECRPLFTTTVLPKGTPGFPKGGWLAEAPDNWGNLSKEEQAKIQKTWRVYYDSPVPLRMDDVVIFRRSFIWPDPADFHPRVAEKGVDLRGCMNPIGQARQIKTPGDTPASMNAGAGVLELTPEKGAAQIWFKLFAATGRGDAGWYATLEEGISYRYEAWVKTTDASAPSTLTFGFGGNRPDSLAKGYFGDTSVNKTFPVTTEWQRIGYTFTAPSTPADGGIEGAILRYEGHGQLLVDNIKLQPVYEPGDEDKPFVINRTLFKTLIDNQPANGRKGALRMWPGLSFVPMPELLEWDSGSDISLRGGIHVSSSRITSIPKTLTVLEATGDLPETRMVPYIMTQVTHDETEYQQLVEYLAAPYDPKTDTPQSKPMAWKRVQQRGNTTPWTETFREIIIDFGNENWHNRANPNWMGMGRSGTIWQAGTEYGLWARYMMEQMHSSPYWNDSIKVSLGGGYQTRVQDGVARGFGPEATMAAKAMNTYEAHATYIGPRWETGESSQTSIDDAGVQKTLFAYRPAKAEEWSRLQDAIETMHKNGFDVKLSAYEGGPSGFGLRAKSKAEDRAGEYYGKSTAMATAVLDSWLDAWRIGFSHQCYLSFAQGKWWSSHTSTSQGHRPSPGFLTQTMINHTVANLDMITATVEDSPIIEVEVPQKNKKYKPGDTIPSQPVETIHAYAFAGKDRLAVAMVNLDLENDTPVELKLPLRSVKKITLHSLNGDPRDTNMDELKVTLAQKEIATDQLKEGVFKTVLQAGKGQILVFKSY